MSDRFEERLTRELRTASGHLEGGQICPGAVRLRVARRQRRRYAVASLAGTALVVVAAAAVGAFRDDDPSRTDLVGAPHIEVVESGYSTYRGQYDVQTGSYGAVIQNASDETATAVSVSVTVFDASGAEIVTQRFRFDQLRPAEKMGFGDEFTAAAGVSRIDVSVDDVGEPGQAEAPDDRLAVSDVTTSSEATGTRTTFRVTSTYPHALFDVQALAIWRSDDGDILGGRFDYVDRIPAEGATTGSVTLSGDLAEIAETDVYLNPDPN